MTDKDWKKVEENITLLSSVEFEVDGHKISVSMCRDNMKLQYAVYVDGSIKGEHMVHPDKAPAVIKKVWYKKKHYLHKPKRRKELKRLGKRMLKELNIDPETHFFLYLPYFNSFRTLKSTWKKNCNNIKCIEN